MKNQIMNRDWKPGEKIPSESQLISLLGVSRGTVGQAVQKLAGEGLFTALQQGTIDARENPLSVIASSKFNEVQEYLSGAEATWLGELEAAGMKINYPEKAAFVEAAKGVYDDFVGEGAGKIPADLLEQIYGIIGR